MVGTGSSVFNSYKSIATKIEYLESNLIDSSTTVNVIDGSNSDFVLERGTLLNASGSTATISDLKVYVNGLEKIVSGLETGTYARINQTDGISAIEESITVDNIVDSNEIPSAGFLYLGNPSGQLKREKIYYSSYSSGIFGGLARGINGTVPTKWVDNTIVEIVGLVTLDSAPVEDSQVFVEYKYSGDAVDRSRSNYELSITNYEFLDSTDSANTGWELDTSTIGTSGSGQMVTDLIGQTALMKVRGTEISVTMQTSTTEGTTALFVIDEGTANEKNVFVDTSSTNEIQKIKSLAISLSDELHTIRLVNLKSQTLAIDALQTNGHVPILKSASSNEIFYTDPITDLNPLTSGEGIVNDVFYWDTLGERIENGELGDKRTNLLASLNATQTAMIVENVDHLADSGVIQIGDEQIKYNAKASDGVTGKLLNLERGYNNTTATNHFISDNEEIISTYSASDTKIYLYDTTKENIDNNWRFDQTKSWYSESSSEYRCPNGYQDSGAQKCTRAFPEVALVVANTRLYVYDAESKELWMAFRSVNYGPYFTGDSGKQVTGAFAENGKILVSARQD